MVSRNTDLLGDLGDLLGKIPIVGAVKDSIQRPELLLARIEVAGGLKKTTVRPFHRVVIGLLSSLQFHRVLFNPSSLKPLVEIMRLLVPPPRPP